MNAFRDLIAFFGTLLTAILVEILLCSVTVQIYDWNARLYEEVLVNSWVGPASIWLGSLFAAFLAVMVGVVLSHIDHKKRNGWLFTFLGVIIYANLFCKIIFIPHRETEHSAFYVLLTSPFIYLYGLGGILASLFTTYRMNRLSSRAN